jgi:tripartite ATP-independent transporter DctM subunit
MDAFMIGVIGIVVMMVLMFLRIPVAYAMSFVGFAGYWVIAGTAPSMEVLRKTFYQQLSNHTFTAVPLFILMGFLAYHSGIVSQLFETARKWVGHISGGLVQATVLGGAAFGAISGSGQASTATLSRITIPEMLKVGVDRKLAYGVVASVGPLAALIPPSVLMIIVAIATEQSIGRLLIGGLVPGIFVALVYMILVSAMVKRNPALAPPIPKVRFAERFRSLKNLWAFLLVVLVIIFGLYTGKFTATEAGAVGAFIIFILFVLREGLHFGKLKDALLQTIKTASTIFIIIAAAFVFSNFLTITRIPSRLSEFLVSLPVDPVLIMIGIIIMYMLIGMIMDMVPAMFITLPIIFPAIVKLGFDPIWFGVMIVFLAEMSLVTPPFGLSLFIVKATNPGSQLKDIYQGSYPFIAADLVIIALFLLFPQIITFLPSLM